jgi:hypothetical protein
MRVAAWVAVLVIVLLAMAWLDGGREPPHEIVEPVPVPGGVG